MLLNIFADGLSSCIILSATHINSAFSKVNSSFSLIKKFYYENDYVKYLFSIFTSGIIIGSHCIFTWIGVTVDS